MSAEEPSAATVLVVEDEDRVAELFVTVLSTEYLVLRAENGAEALELIDKSVDVVLLDRRMPEMTGDAVLEQMEANDIDCRIAMVSGVDADTDVIDMGFDDYLVKPVDNAALLNTVERLLALDQYEAVYQDLSAKRVKKNVLEVEKSAAELEVSDEFQRLQAEITELESRLDDIVGEQEFTESQLPN